MSIFTSCASARSRPRTRTRHRYGLASFVDVFDHYRKLVSDRKTKGKRGMPAFAEPSEPSAFPTKTGDARKTSGPPAASGESPVRHASTASRASTAPTTAPLTASNSTNLRHATSRQTSRDVSPPSTLSNGVAAVVGASGDAPAPVAAASTTKRAATTTQRDATNAPTAQRSSATQRADTLATQRAPVARIEDVAAPALAEKNNNHIRRKNSKKETLIGSPPRSRVNVGSAFVDAGGNRKLRSDKTDDPQKSVTQPTPKDTAPQISSTVQMKSGRVAAEKGDKVPPPQAVAQLQQPATTAPALAQAPAPKLPPQATSQTNPLRSRDIGSRLVADRASYYSSLSQGQPRPAFGEFCTRYGPTTIRIGLDSFVQPSSSDQHSGETEKGSSEHSDNDVVMKDAEDAAGMPEPERNEPLDEAANRRTAPLASPDGTSYGGTPAQSSPVKSPVDQRTITKDRLNDAAQRLSEMRVSETHNKENSSGSVNERDARPSSGPVPTDTSANQKDDHTNQSKDQSLPLNQAISIDTSAAATAAPATKVGQTARTPGRAARMCRVRLSSTSSSFGGEQQALSLAPSTSESIALSVAPSTSESIALSVAPSTSESTASLASAEPPPDGELTSIASLWNHYRATNPKPGRGPLARLSSETGAEPSPMLDTLKPGDDDDQELTPKGSDINSDRTPTLEDDNNRKNAKLTPASSEGSNTTEKQDFTDGEYPSSSGTNSVQVTPDPTALEKKSNYGSIYRTTPRNTFTRYIQTLETYIDGVRHDTASAEPGAAADAPPNGATDETAYLHHRMRMKMKSWADPPKQVIIRRKQQSMERSSAPTRPPDGVFKPCPYFDLVEDLLQPTVFNQFDYEDASIPGQRCYLCKFTNPVANLADMYSLGHRSMNPDNPMDVFVPPGIHAISVNGEAIPFSNKSRHQEIDITEKVQPGLNVLVLTMSPTLANNYVIAVQYVQYHCLSDLLNRITTLDQDRAQQLALKKFFSHSTSHGRASDIGLVSSVEVTLVCPITRQRMVKPVRGTACAHVHCFDAATFLTLGFPKRGEELTCPHCRRVTPFKDLMVDGFLSYILSGLEEGDGIDRVTVRPSGGWEVTGPRALRTEHPNLLDLSANESVVCLN